MQQVLLKTSRTLVSLTSVLRLSGSATTSPTLVVTQNASLYGVSRQAPSALTTTTSPTLRTPSSPL
jgi:hypothetical protein